MRVIPLIFLAGVVLGSPQSIRMPSSSSSSSSCREDCTKIYLPVCGSDGRTYNNECLLNAASCRNLENDRPRITIQYPNVCDEDVGADSCSKKCSSTFTPICSSHRITYHNRCELSIAMCRDKKVSVLHEGSCTGFTGRIGSQPSLEVPRTPLAVAAAPVVTANCPDTCTGGFRPVCGSDGITYGSDCYLELAKCRYPGLTKKADGVCAKDCSLECDPSRNLVCGTDGITYTNDCFLLLASCRDPSVKRQHEGACQFVERPECQVSRCPSASDGAICGSDGITYINDCHYKSAICYNRGLLKLYDGPCKH